MTFFNFVGGGAGASLALATGKGCYTPSSELLAASLPCRKTKCESDCEYCIIKMIAMDNFYFSSVPQLLAMVCNNNIILLTFE